MHAHVQMHLRGSGSARHDTPVNRHERRRSSRLNRRPAANCPPAHLHRCVVPLVIADALLVVLFLAAALTAQPAVATIAGTACVTVSLQIARHPRR